MAADQDQNEPPASQKADPPAEQVKFTVYGRVMIEKTVKPSGNSGRVYLPPEWVGAKIKVIRIK